jgi:prepilin-type processing-associated H-X9-DG protein
MSLFAVVALILLQSGGNRTGPDLSTPEHSVQSFVAAYQKLDMRQAAMCVYGVSLNTAMLDSFSHITPALRAQFRATLNLSLHNFKTETSGRDATVVVDVGNNEGAPITERIPLRHTDGGWKIVGFDAKNAFSSQPSSAEFMQASPVRILATSFLLFPVFVAAREKARVIVCRSNLKQLALGTLMWVQDHSDRGFFKAVDFKKSIMPYLKNAQIFHCASDVPGHDSYSFNAGLQGVDMDTLAHPEAIVMVYEGSRGILQFRHSGSANVVFADGTVRAMTRAQAKSLRWKP